MDFQLSDLYTLLPEIFLLVGVSGILLLDLFLSKEQRGITYGLSLVVLIVTSVLPWFFYDADPRVIMSGLVVSDLLGAALKSTVCVLVAVGLVYSKSYLLSRGLHRGEYFSLTLFATLGMMVMISSNHFLSLYLGLELLSLSLYAMVALQRDSGRSSEAAIKYFVLGAIASGITGIGAGAEEILIPEQDMGRERLIESLKKSKKSGKTSSIIVISEGDQIGKNIFKLASYIEDNLTGYEVRVTVLGHIQRGGSPSCFDRVLASRLGVKAVDALIDNQKNVMIGIRHNKLICVPFIETLKTSKELDLELIRVADITSI